MKVFVTGGSGYIGSAVITELIKSGHEVLSLARSQEAAEKILSLGKEVKILRGGLEDLDILKKGALEASGVLHLGFVHDFKNFDKSCEIDRAATVVMLESLKGTHKPFIYTSGTLSLPAGKISDENVSINEGIFSARGETEEIALSYKNKGVRVAAIRLAPTVHGKGDKAFIPILINVAKTLRKSAYIGDGQSVWPAVTRLDAAHLYRLVLEKGSAGRAYHAVAEQGIRTKDIAETIGELLDVPVVSIPIDKASENFGFLGAFFAKDTPVSSEITRKELGWEPKGLGLLDDMKENYTI